MNLQIIKSIEGKDEYVLLPLKIYNALHHQIQKKMQSVKIKNEYIDFDPAEYVDNPVALARIQADITQEDLARVLEVSQAYISKLENQDKVSVKMQARVHTALKSLIKNK